MKKTIVFCLLLSGCQKPNENIVPQTMTQINVNAVVHEETSLINDGQVVIVEIEDAANEDFVESEDFKQMHKNQYTSDSIYRLYEKGIIPLDSCFTIYERLRLK